MQCGDKFEAIQINDITKFNIWCGAGISRNHPCGLPSGYELSLHILEEYMQDQFQIKKVWGKCNEVIKKIIEPHEFVRPEVMISCISRMGGLSATCNFFSEFADLRSAAFNDNHIFLAAFVKNGGTVYTTNFDICIEKALEEKFHEELQTEIFCNGKVVTYSLGNGGSIVHLHGIFEYGTSAGASIETVMKGYDTKSIQMIENAFDDSVNVFIGYSFSDDYDLNVLFRKYSGKSEAIWVCNHNGLDASLAYKAWDICGKSVKLINCDTAELLKSLISQTRYEENRVPENPLMLSTDWKAILKFPEDMSADYKMLYTLELLNQLQISYKRINKNLLKRLKMLDMTIKNELGKYSDILLYNMFTNSAYCAGGSVRNIKLTDLQQAMKNRFSNNIFRLKAMIDLYNRENYLDKIVKKLQAGEILTNPDHEVISSYMRFYTAAYQMGAIIENLELLKEVNRLTCNLDYDHGAELYMFAARLRYKYLLYQNEMDFREALKIYYDIGNIGGVISTLFAKAIVKSRENGKLIILQEEWGAAVSLIKIVQHNRYRIKGLSLSLFDAMKHIPFLKTIVCKLIFNN